MQFEDQKIYEYIDAHQQEYIDRLGRLIAQKSLAGVHEGIEEMGALVVRELEQQGLKVTECPTPGNTCYIGDVKGESDKVLGFYDHYDVQPVEPLELWKSDPWKLDIRDGNLYGRGVSDNKGGIAASLAAIDAYQKVYGKLPCSVKMMLEGEEEIGSGNLPYFTEKYKDQLFCDGIIFEGGTRGSDGGPCVITLGNKGCLYIELKVKTASMDAHSSLAAIVENPAWRLVKALSSFKDDQDRVLIEGFYDGIQPLTEEDIEILKQDGFDIEGTKKYLGLDHYLNHMDGIELLEHYHYVPTANIAGFSSGWEGVGVKTVLPGEATAKMDFRLVPGQDPDHILELVKAHLHKHGFDDVQVTKLLGEPAYRSDSKSTFAAILKETAKQVTGQEPTMDYQAAGTCPLAYFCAEKNIPAAMAGTGTPNSNVHAPNEFYKVEDFVADIKFRATLMHKLGGNQ